ncbi:MAG TPA: DUF2167 domain-containing protein [Rhodopila sp.]
MRRDVLGIFLAAIVSTRALAAPPEKDPTGDLLATPEQIVAAAMRQSIGAPAKADLDEQATVRLSDNLMLVPRDPASRLLKARGDPVPPGFDALLVSAEGMDAPGLIRFVPSGFIDSDAALGWTPEDILSSLNDTLDRGDQQRARQNLPGREARTWVIAPRYNPAAHQLAWAALVVPRTAPRDSDGEVTYHAIGFGREGYIELTVVSGMQKAEVIGAMVDGFLDGLNFRPGKGYGDVVPSDHRDGRGLAGAMGLDALEKAHSSSSFWTSDSFVPVIGSIVASIGGLSLLIYVRRHLRRRSRRV